MNTFENYGEITIYRTSSLRPPAGGLKDNRQAFQCLIQKVNIYFTSRPRAAEASAEAQGIE